MVDDLIQGSPSWFAERLGKVTASRVSDVIARTKSGPAASRKNYMAELVAERLTGKTADSYTNAAMKHGIDTEPQARAAYAFFRDAEVGEVGFVDHPRIPMTGASPDGLVGGDGLIEIKCPNTATHIDTLLSKSISDKHRVQMAWQMTCTGRAWVDFVSFDPRLPENLQLFVQRVHRNPALIDELEEAVTEFLAELDQTVEALTKLAQEAA